MPDHNARRRFQEYLLIDRRRSRGLTADELERWTLLKRLLNNEFSPDLAESQDDRRDSVRVPTNIAVSFESNGVLRHCQMANLSRGGLFVQTDHVLPIGTRIAVRLPLGASGQRVDVPVQVVSQNVGRRGMGLSFLDLDAEQQKRLDDFYETSLRKAFESS